MSSDPHHLHHLRGTEVSVVVDVSAGVPEIAYWGPTLNDADVVSDAWTRSQTRTVAEAGPDITTAAALVAEPASGFLGAPGLIGHRPDGTGFAPRFSLLDTKTESGPSGTSGAKLSTRSADATAELELSCEVELDSSDVLICRAQVTNTGPTNYQLDGLALSLAVPEVATELLSFSGRWCGEYRPHRNRWEVGSTAVENRAGRTSHDRVPVVFAGTAGFGEGHGEVWGVHLGWSGNSRVNAEVTIDGSRHLQLGELLLPGEMVLAPGESYSTPEAFGTYSATGASAASRRFHRHLRQRANHPGSDRPRPVGLNTWEAVYFFHDLDTLTQLADRAAEVGVERYVLDDGWFHGRRDDTAGLGDWWVDTDVWPNGLKPLIDHVTRLGLEFGIWVEPEMVNPNSELYRTHPEWVLTADGYDPVLARNQLVLDLANPEVFDYLYDHLNRLLAEHPDVRYVKWDMNRNLVHPAHDGRAGVHHQTQALYRLIDALRTAHPDVEIESCASGGGRADFEILKRTDRVWTSDCNDALERQMIQRGFSHLFPPEIMGAHIGPTHSHTTGRHHGLAFRAMTAIFGHLGIEWNILAANPYELDQLKSIISFYKTHRGLLHTGDVYRYDHPNASINAHGVIAADKTEAMVSITQLVTDAAARPAPMRIDGLDPDMVYTVKRITFGGDLAPGKNKATPPWLDEGVSATGRLLHQVGLQLPAMHPESTLLLHLRA